VYALLVGPSRRTLFVMPYPQKLSEPQILEEAARLVDDVGLDALSMRVLARRLGAHAPSLYRYFPDKETLVRAVSARFWDDLAHEVDRHDSLAGMARAYWDYGLRYPNRYAVIMSRPPETEPSATGRFDVTEPLHGLAAPLSPDRALVARRVLWSYLHGAVSMRLLWPTREGPDPEEAFAAGLQAFEAWLAAGAGDGRSD
jgi:TetR/AcrR family transcriptional regulator, tetracycline repressor protein